MKGMQDCIEFLNELGVDYELVEHGEVFTIEEAMAEPALKGREEIKNLFIQDDKGKRYYLVVMPGLKKLDLKQLATDLGEKKVRFCSPQKVESMLGVKPGSVSLFCCLNESSRHVTVVFDKDLLTKKECGFHPIVNTATIFMKPKGVMKILSELSQDCRIADV